jgi:hypothetical protein
VRQRVTGHEERTPEVDAELHVEALGGEVGDRARESHSGRVDEHVETAVAFDVLGHHARTVLLVQHARGHGVRIELLRGDLEPLDGAGGDRQPEPLVAEHARDREADTRRSPGHQRRRHSEILPHERRRPPSGAAVFGG